MADGPRIGRKKISAQYREVVWSGQAPEATLQSALTSTLDSNIDGRRCGDDVALRTLDSADDRQLLLNEIEVTDDYVFGELVAAAPGGLVPLVARSAIPIPVLPLRQDLPAKGHDFMPGLLYFMAIGNHMVVVEGQAIRSSLLLTFLDWFLGPSRGDLAAPGAIKLVPQVRVETGGAAAPPPVTAAIFEPQHAERKEIRARAASAKNEVERTRVLSETSFLDDRGRGILEAAGATDASLAKILKRLGKDATLEVTLQVRAKIRNKPAPIQPTFFNDLFAATEADRVVLNGPSGKQVGEMTRLKHDITVSTIGSLLSRPDVEHALWTAYRVFVGDGRIAPAR